ncbi:MAG: hypothetical protein A2X86_07645 [Bdellovibrionales bacterium GWA2_49_15]|nr:MAG: hypothetical protein A2X86_07645 [Bdellovibrionales bacterium GWA2_49_15]HAZ11849.1 hypothetical protein [Bdellovibrionales bacterium]
MFELKNDLILVDKWVMKNLAGKDSILDLGDRYENRGNRILIHIAVRLINSFFHFKKKKGDLVAGCATFFVIISFCPVMLLLISLAGHLIGDVELAKTSVMEALKGNFPSIAPWILQSIEKIINAQLTTTASANIVNLFLLMYSSLGVIASVVFGMDTISDTESRGGFVIEDIKAIGLGAFAYFFMLSLIICSNPKILGIVLSNHNMWGRNFILALSSNSILPVLLSVAFFAVFYKIAPSRSIALKDSLWGAGAFVGCFIFGKSFYWIYIRYAKDGLATNFGDFYTMIVAAVWVYFLMSAFFYGASVAYMNKPLKIVEEAAPPLAEIPTTETLPRPVDEVDKAS